MAAGKPRIEVHPLGIGDREHPARLVFEGKEGDAIVVSLIDMGGRLRLICQDIHCVKPIMPMPNLPVARVMWQAEPSLTTGVECWITAGGAHHTVLSYDVTAEQMKDWANMMDIEFCYPSTLILGDIITALQSGKYDLDDVVVAITQTGGQCRATNYLAQIKSGLMNADFPIFRCWCLLPERFFRTIRRRLNYRFLS